MVIPLLILLVFALSITFVGLWLTTKNQFPLERERISYASRSYGMRGVRRVGENRHIQVRRSSLKVERRGWTHIFAWLNVEHIFEQRADETFWLGITLLLLLLFLLGVYSLQLMLPNSRLVWAALPGVSTSSSTTTTNKSTLNTSLRMASSASKALVRLNQLDPSQYNSLQDYNTWAYSACSPAAMAEIINAYGHHYRVADILKVEYQLGEITPQQGLLTANGIDRTVATFGFKTVWLNKPSLDGIISIANSGRPVIVGFPPDKYIGGHILVVVGGNSNYVYTADSSLYNRHSFTRSFFMSLWEGFAAVVTPVTQS